MSVSHSSAPLAVGQVPTADPVLGGVPAWEYEPWTWHDVADTAERGRMSATIQALVASGHTIAPDALIARLAVVTADHLSLGSRSYLAAFTHVSGDVTIGHDCSVNVGTVVRGTVTIGNATRIGATTAILGFDHTFADPATPVFRQPLRSRGIRIGEDVWIGSHVVIRDGVTIGSHAVIGAGSVVTRDVPDWAIAVGNPARVVRDRRAPSTGSVAPATSGAAAGALSARTAAEVGRRLADAIPDLLTAAWDGENYHNVPDGPASLRAHTDSLELADLFGLETPGGSRADHIRALQNLQDPLTGLISEPGIDPQGAPTGLPDQGRAYHILSIGSALALLGSQLLHPVHAITDLTASDLLRELDALDTRYDPWGVGAQVDAVGTALTWQTLAGRATDGLLEATIGWVLARRDPGTGLWGSAAGGLRQPVNGTYRLVRGTLASWGVHPGGQEALVDTVLRRASEPDALRTACDALDVIHPLWWAYQSIPAYRAADVRSVAQNTVLTAQSRFAAGWAFEPGTPISLQGTEMWAAICWYAADLCGVSDALGYRPRGIHRPEPWIDLPATHGRRLQKEI